MVTDDTWLYERLVLETQHPYRHRRELGLSAGCETALHARVHPLAVAWALAAFDDALARVRGRQSDVGRLFQAAVESGLIESPSYASQGLAPSYTRVTGVWSGKRCWTRLQSVLDRADLPWEVVPAALTLLPSLPTVPAPIDVSRRCAVAYGAVRKRCEFIPKYIQETV